jgi:amidophosphoribosyltransferase
LKSWREECGVFGIWNHPEASRLTYLGLFAIQHRGQESAGIVTLSKNDKNPEGIHIHHKGLGLVGDVFSESDLNRLQGTASIGHVRYSTTGQNLLTNAQPLTAQLLSGPLAVAHNGNIVNNEALKKELQQQGSIFQGTNDTEILLHLLSRHPSHDLIVALKESLPKIQGAFSLTILSHNKLVAVRDSYGFRPLVIGTLNKNSYVVASETCALDLIGAQFLREVEPGEIFWVDDEGPHSTFFKEPATQEPKNQNLARCIFEHVYFARPDSVVFGKSVYESRKAFGVKLAEEFPTEADIVIPVPDSGVTAAIGYSKKSGIPFELGIIRNHYVGRTFIQPHQSIRDFGVKIKLNPQSEVLKGQRVIVIDDSLVRGTTSKQIINLIRQAGAKEVHMRIASPPTISPCYYGVDTPQKKQLIAAQSSCDEICDFIGADSLKYLSIEGMLESLGEKQGYCAACFTGKYPTELS